jgi:hypothetical protein
VPISGIDLLGVMYRRFPLTHEIIHGEFGAIKRLNLKYVLTPLPCQSHIETNDLKSMSSLYVILFYNLFVTI